MGRPKFSYVSSGLLKFDNLDVAIDTRLSPVELLRTVQLRRPIAVFFHRNRDLSVHVAVGREPKIWPEDWNDAVI